MKISNKLFIVLSFTIFLGNFIFSQEKVESQQILSYMYVAAGDGLNLRVNPTIQSQIIRTLPFLAKVNVLEKSENSFLIDGISSQWYRVSIDNDTGWVFGGFLSNIIDIPKLKDKEFIALYRINNIDIDSDSFGHENLLNRLKKSYLVIYETTGNKRYIYDDIGLIESVPRFGESILGYDIIITGLYKYPWSPNDDNRELTDTIIITFQSRRKNQDNEIIINYNILVTYGRIKIE